MQNFVGKTKCIAGYMKVADYVEVLRQSQSNAADGCRAYNADSHL